MLQVVLADPQKKLTKNDDNVEEMLHAAAEKEGPQDFDKDGVIVAGESGKNIPQAKTVAASVDVPVFALSEVTLRIVS